MKRMKKILALSLSAVLLLGLLCACGDPGAENSDPVGANTSGTISSQEPSNGPAQVDLAAFYLAMTEKYPGELPSTPEELYPEEMVDDDEMWAFGPDTREERLQEVEKLRSDYYEMNLTFYPGLTDITTEQCLVYASQMSFSGSEVVLIQVSDAADVNAVKAILQTRIDFQAGDDENPGGAWYDDASKNWKNNSRIVSNGSYVMLVVSESCDNIVNDFNALFA